MKKNWYALRWEILKRDNFTCQYCGQMAPQVVLHIDHKTAKFNGGNDDKDNLVACCSACNIGKSTTPLTLIDNDPVISEKGPPPLERLTLAFLRENGPNTATEIAKAIGKHRVNVSTFLNHSKSVQRLQSKKGRRVLFCVDN